MKITTFEQFDQAVKELADGKYFAVYMEKETFSDSAGGKSKYQYNCYIDNQDWHRGDSPEESINKLKMHMGLIPTVIIEAEIK